jgi:hypothetical protein
MKKIVFVHIFGLVISGLMFAQVEPVMGYDRVEWGASVDDVIRAFNLENDFVFEENFDNDPNIARLTQNNVSQNIIRRYFLFNKWYSNEYKLYRVWVYYATDSILDDLLTTLTNRYGDRTETRFHFPNILNSYIIGQDTYVFEKYSPELVIEILHRYSDNPASKISEPVTVTYTWKTFRDDYLNNYMEL